MATTIQISDDIKLTLEKMKLYNRESYNEIIKRMVEDNTELNEKTKQEIESRTKEKSISHDEVKKRLGF
tara:strand:+ start:352 stop:558 length:207 start_codon:yes stop_codon:yes gene_type:complete